MKKDEVIVVIIILLIIIVVWGLVGGDEAQDVGVTCDTGIEKLDLCWAWHKNIVGEIIEGFNDAFGS